jgi:predicted transcriptional regulator
MTGDAVAELIRNDERGFAGTGEIADHFDVTRQAVRNRREELRHHPDLGVDKIGRTTVFYTTTDGADETDEGETHTMHQMQASRIGTLALGVSALAGAIAQVPFQAIALVVLGVLGLGLIGWGIAPLLDAELQLAGRSEVAADE